METTLIIKNLNMKSALIFGAALFLATGCKTKSPMKLASPAIEETYWKLVEVNGNPVSLPSDAKTIYLVLKKEGGRAQGFGGCNGFGGSYELLSGNRIRFSQVISTMMACDHLDIENQFLKVLQTADNYNLVENQLVLNRARMAPLARFEAVKSID